MNSWFYLLQWMLIMAMVSMSYEMSVRRPQASISISSGQNENPTQESGMIAERVKRFTSLPLATQEKVLSYGENLLRYLELEEKSRDSQCLTRGQV